jgi:hypothetical protein
MCGFGCTTDLGKMVFYFSCKNYSLKVYTCFVEVAVLVTQSTTKLALQFLDFSTILNGFYKSLDQRGKTRRIYFCPSPWKVLNSHTTAP